MKNKILNAVLGIAVISITLFLSCSKDEVKKPLDNNNTILKEQSNVIQRISNSTNNHFLASFTADNLIITYEARTNNGVTNSSFKIIDTLENGKKPIELKYVLNQNLTSYKLRSHEGVISEAEKEKNNFNLTEIKNIVLIIEKIGKSIVEKEPNYTSPLIQSLFFHNAILNTIKRYLENEKCGCTPHPGYFIDKTPFWCQEDYYINPGKIYSKIKDSLSVGDTTEMKVLSFLENHKNETEISIDNIFNIIESNHDYMIRIGSFNQGTGLVTCMLGSDLGCCGNYAGCCWYWSWLCLAHDIECINCDHWHCGPSCNPGGI